MEHEREQYTNKFGESKSEEQGRAAVEAVTRAQGSAPLIGSTPQGQDSVVKQSTTFPTNDGLSLSTELTANETVVNETVGEAAGFSPTAIEHLSDARPDLLSAGAGGQRLTRSPLCNQGHMNTREILGGD